MRERPPHGRRIKTLPLPGDEAEVLAADYARAVRRDDKLTWPELLAKMCVTQQLVYNLNFCLLDECSFCGGLEGWQRWEIAHRDARLG
jgi:hypothetical protein